MRNSFEDNQFINDCDGIEKLSDKIRLLGLTPLVEFLIESHQPAFNILHSIFLCAKPFLVPFVSSHSVLTMEHILADRPAREYLLSKLNSEASS